MRAYDLPRLAAAKTECGACSEHRPHSGRWLRQGERIVVLLRGGGQTVQPPKKGEVAGGGDVATLAAEQRDLSAGTPADELLVDRVPLLRKHAGIGPDLIITWNDLGRAPRAVDVVVHLHGYSLARGRRLHILRDLFPRSGLNWSNPKGDGGSARRTRPTVALLPRGHFFGGTSGRGYSFPALTTPEGLKRLIAFALQRLAAEKNLTGLTVDRLILTAHSGGGAPLLQILRHVDPHEVHVFDGLYQDASSLIRWANSRIARDRNALASGAGRVESYMVQRGGALRVLYGRGTAAHSRKVATALRTAIPPGSALARWYRVEPTATGHVQIPPIYGWRLLADAGADLPGVPPITKKPPSSRATEIADEEFEAPPRAEAGRVAQAIARGERDENKLANLVFFARHPERAGRRLIAGEPGFDTLSREWLQIRDRVVRPTLSGSAPPARKSRCEPVRCTERGTALQRIKALVPLLTRYRREVPLELLLGWIAVESGGCIGVVTGLCERGYFQIHPDESKGLRLDHERLSTDREYSVRAGIEMVRARAAKAGRRGFVPGTDLYWRMAKLEHWLPRGVDVILRLMKEGGITPTSWDQLRRFAMENRDRILQILEQSRGSGWDPAKGIANVEKTFARGRELAAALRSP